MIYLYKCNRYKRNNKEICHIDDLINYEIKCPVIVYDLPKTEDRRYVLKE